MPGINTTSGHRRLPAPAKPMTCPLLCLPSWEPIEPSVWRDEKKMKEELVAWAKAIAAVAAALFSQDQIPNL
ncbi:hypothetical protein HPP92_015742 [Vanilla planifolia]|uniref:Uncharacterized protein n=1 Tax=Vanilla planifolia TaxID=51239 RepID=A0A835QHW0_VANPL|nr:hypothetical protein HPP92_016353 [Vanilla planifolia]KAG0471196.1 hypothetical protein HPP92_015742 [Vanilla planifolia]